MRTSHRKRIYLGNAANQLLGQVNFTRVMGTPVALGIQGLGWVVTHVSIIEARGNLCSRCRM